MFVVDHPPASPVLLEYGEGFAAFLDELEIIDDMPHLRRCVRASNGSFTRHATPPMQYRSTRRLSPGSILSAQPISMFTVLRLSCFLLESKHAVFSLWRSSIAEEPIAFPEPSDAEASKFSSRAGASRRRPCAYLRRLRVHIFADAWGAAWRSRRGRLRRELRLSARPRNGAAHRPRKP